MFVYSYLLSTLRHVTQSCSVYATTRAIMVRIAVKSVKYLPVGA